jgi:hypothetical protein
MDEGRGRGDEDEKQKDEQLNMYTLACPDSGGPLALPEMVHINASGKSGIVLKELKHPEECARKQVMTPGKKVARFDWDQIMDIRAAEAMNSNHMDYFELVGKFGMARFECEDSRLIRKEIVKHCPAQHKRTVRGPLIDDDVYDDSVMYGDREDHDEAMFVCTDLVGELHKEVAEKSQGILTDRAASIRNKVWRIQRSRDEKLAAFFNDTLQRLADDGSNDVLVASLTVALVPLVGMAVDEATKAVTIFLREQPKESFNFDEFCKYLVKRGHDEVYIRNCLFTTAFTHEVKGTKVLKVIPRISDEQLMESFKKMEWGVCEDELKEMCAEFLSDGGGRPKRDVETRKISAFFNDDMESTSSNQVLLPGDFFLMANGNGLHACTQIKLDATSCRNVARRNVRKFIDHVVQRWRWDSISHFRATGQTVVFISGDFMYLMQTPPPITEGKVGYVQEDCQSQKSTARAIRSEYRAWVGEEDKDPNIDDERLHIHAVQTKIDAELADFIEEAAIKPIAAQSDKPKEGFGDAASAMDWKLLYPFDVAVGMKVLFVRYAPKQVSSIAHLIATSEGKEHEMLNNLREEYGESYFNSQGKLVFPQIKTAEAIKQIELLYDEYEPVKRRNRLKQALPDLLHENECNEWLLLNKCRQKYCESFVDENTGELNGNQEGFAKLVFNSAVENDGEFDPAILKMRPWNPVSGLLDDAITAVQITKFSETKPVMFTIEVHLNNGTKNTILKQAKDFNKLYNKNMPVADRSILKEKMCVPPPTQKDQVKYKLELNRWFFKVFQMVSNKHISVDAKHALDDFLQTCSTKGGADTDESQEAAVKRIATKIQKVDKDREKTVKKIHQLLKDSWQETFHHLAHYEEPDEDDPARKIYINYEPTKKMSGIRRKLVKLHKELAHLNRKHELVESENRNISQDQYKKKMIDQDSREDNKCLICHEYFQIGDVLKSTPCDHDFHAECLDKWFTGRTSSTTTDDTEAVNTCPCCQREVYKKASADDDWRNK